MTDAAPAPGLTDVWNLVLAVADRQPIQLRVMIVLAALVVLILIVDGIRANVRRVKPQALHIVRLPYGPPRISLAATVANGGKTRPLRVFKVRRPEKISRPFKPPKPRINRVSHDEPAHSRAYQPTGREESREDPAPPL